MSIGLQCTACGRRYRVADDRAGSLITCQCGRSIRVEGQRCMDKLCARCGIDVSSLTRTRDAHGHYYCQPCWDDITKARRTAASRTREPEFAWITRQLSQIRLRQLVKPLIVLCTLVLLGLSWVEPQLGEVTGACLLVLGGALLVVCTVWLYVIPFRDGLSMGLACIVNRTQRRQWAQRNPEFNLRRPAALALTGLGVVLLSLAFFAIWIAARRHLGQ